MMSDSIHRIIFLYFLQIEMNQFENAIPNILGAKVLIPSSLIGCFIGRGGVTVKNLMAQTSCSIQLLQCPANFATDEWMCLVVGRMENILKVIDFIGRMIRNGFCDGPRDAYDIPYCNRNTEMKLVMCHLTAGKVIGRMAENVRQITHTTKAKIQVFPKKSSPEFNLTSDRVVTIAHSWHIMMMDAVKAVVERAATVRVVVNAEEVAEKQQDLTYAEKEKLLNMGFNLGVEAMAEFYAEVEQVVSASSSTSATRSRTESEGSDEETSALKDIQMRLEAMKLLHETGNAHMAMAAKMTAEARDNGMLEGDLLPQEICDNVRLGFEALKTNLLLKYKETDGIDISDFLKERLEEWNRKHEKKSEHWDELSAKFFAGGQ